MKLTNISIAKRIFAITILFLSGLTFFAAEETLYQWEIDQKNYRVIEVTKVASEMNQLINELQKERGYSAGYISSKGNKNFLNLLTKQYEKTNSTLEVLAQHLNKFPYEVYPQEYGNKIQTATAELTKLEKVRKQVKNFDYTVANMAQYYTSIINHMLSANAQTATFAASVKVADALAATAFFNYMKESAGLERAMGAAYFNGGKVNRHIYEKFTHLVSQQTSYEKAFLNLAQKSFIELYRNEVNSAVTAPVEKYRQEIFNSPFTENWSTQTKAIDWFNTITAKIDKMSEVQNKLSEYVTQLSIEAEAKVKQHIKFIIALWLGITILGLIAYVVINRSIKQSIKIIVSDFETSVDDALKTTSTLVEQVYQESHSIKGKCEKISSQSDSVKENTEENSANTQLAISAIDEMSIASQEISQTILETARTSEDVNQSAGNSGRQVQELQASMKRISGMVEMITNLADQTNLLALNAAIESARAGDAGRGFAVVAEEVKKLANETASSTEAIEKEVILIDKQTEETVVAIQGVISSIQNVNDQTQSISSASEEQSSVTENVRASTSTMLQNNENVIDCVSLLSTELSSLLQSSGDMSSGAQNVVTHIETLEESMSKFKKKMAKL